MSTTPHPPRIIPCLFYRNVPAYIDDVDRRSDPAKAAGAEIVHPPKDAHCGRNHWADNPEGHSWLFTTSSGGA